MSRADLSMTVDLGPIGYGYEHRKHPFRVRLDARPLVQLLESVESAQQLYALWQIDRPGDLCPWVRVVLEEVSSLVTDLVARARIKTDKATGSNAWPEGQIPLPDFDELFFWCSDDTRAEDEAWLNFRASETMSGFIDRLFSVVRDAQSRLEYGDEITRHVVSLMKARRHPFDYLHRGSSKLLPWDRPPRISRHTPDFLRQLEVILRDPDLASVSCRGEGDIGILRAMANEQRSRARKSGHGIGDALYLAALVSYRIDNQAWGSEIWFHDEGLAHGDLRIEDRVEHGGNLKTQIWAGLCHPGKYILTAHDAGDLPGFAREVGDGWVRYTRNPADSRRTALESNAFRRGKGFSTVLAFAQTGATIFRYEKAIFFIGARVSAEARKVLAETMAEWQHAGGDPVVVIEGDSEPFAQAGCTRWFGLPDHLPNDEARDNWLSDLVKWTRPWIDVVAVFAPPAWAVNSLARATHWQKKPWAPWVIATENVGVLRADNQYQLSEPALQVDWVIEGSLDRALVEAVARGRNREY